LALDRNESNVTTGDIVLGYLPAPTQDSSPAALRFQNPLVSPVPPLLLYLPTATNPRLPFITPPAATGSYNSHNAAEVVVHRDDQRNGRVGLSFGAAVQ